MFDACNLKRDAHERRVLVLLLVFDQAEIGFVEGQGKVSKVGNSMLM